MPSLRRRTQAACPGKGRLTFLGALSLAAALAFSPSSLFGKPKAFPARGFDSNYLTDEEAEERLQRYRDYLGIRPAAEAFHHGYSLKFRVERQARGAEKVVREGVLSGLAFGHGLMRLDLPASGPGEKGRCFLMQNAPEPVVLRCEYGARPEKLEAKDLFTPLGDGLSHSLFDLMLPFVFWDAEYEKSGKVVGRPSHLYAFSPPAWAREVKPDLRRIRLALDDVYDAPLRVEYFGKRGVPDRSFALVSLKKVGEEWVPKTLDGRDALTRSKTRFRITAAATDLDLGIRPFKPEGMSETLPVREDVYVSIE